MRYRDISIRKKILLSNFLMILIPVLIVCSILAVLLLGFSFLTDSSSSLIRNVLLNSSNYGPTLLIKTMNDELSDHSAITSDANMIFKQLEDIQLHILIKDQQDILYITQGYSEKTIQKEFREIAQSTSYEVPYILWNQNGLAYASNIQTKEGKTLQVTFSGLGLTLPKDSYASWEHTKFMIKVGIIGTGFTMIVLILLLGIVLTKKLSRYILQPLAQLQFATNEIKHGNLHNEITSSTHDEFGELCDNFEDMRKQLVTSDKLQKQYETQRKEMIAGISHDISTPLTSMQGYVNALLDGIADTPEKQHHYLEIIQTKTMLMNELVESLFLLSKLDMGEEPIQMSPTNIANYLYEWISQEQTKYQERGLTLHYNQEDAQQPLVQLDPLLFVRVLHNLCENSIKYRKTDHGNMKINLTSTTRDCILTLQDDGIGASKEDIKHLFERFYRADPSRTSKIKGNGLGLSITKHIIEQMGGSIWADGEYGSGLCIHITLPIIQEVSHEKDSNH